MIDAAKRASAKRITAVCPYYGYSRQDRKSTGREPITAKLVADVLQAAGADRVVSVDLHSGQIQGFFDVPFDHLTAAPVLEGYLRDHLLDDVVVVAPDAGRVKVAERYSQHLGCDLALVHKTRPRGTTNQVEARHVVGEVAGPPLRDHRRHDRHGRDHLRRRGAPGRRRGGRHLGHGHPRRAVRPRRRPAEGSPDLPGGGDRHPARRPRIAGSTSWRSCRWPRSSPTPSTPCSRTPRSRISSGARTWPDPPEGSDPGTAGGGPDAGRGSSGPAVPTTLRRPLVLPRGPSCPVATIDLEETQSCPRSRLQAEARPPPRARAPPAVSGPRGKMPGVVYGHGTDPVAVAVVGRDLRTALSGESGSTPCSSLQAGDQTFLTLAREMQRHPVQGHGHPRRLPDRAAATRCISAEVPVNLVGEALEVHHGDGLVDQQLFSLTVRARPADIPASLEVDVTDLTIGGSVRVADLALPPGVTDRGRRRGGRGRRTAAPAAVEEPPPRARRPRPLRRGCDPGPGRRRGRRQDEG